MGTASAFTTVCFYLPVDTTSANNTIWPSPPMLTTRADGTICFKLSVATIIAYTAFDFVLPMLAPLVSRF